MTSSLLDKTLATIAELPNHPEGYGFLIDEAALEDFNTTAEKFIRMLFDEVELPLTIEQTIHGNLVISLDYDAIRAHQKERAQ